jgi:hypothetical protein
VLTTDPVLAASLPGHVECSAHYHSLTTTDELVIKEITGSSRGLHIAEQLNLQNRLELCFLKLEWVPRSQSAQDELLEYTDEEVLEKFQPNETLEHFVLVKYTGYVFPTWMMNKLTSLPYLVNLCLFHLHNCSALPPIGHLRNLRYLHIKDMPNLRDLEMGLSGGPVSLGKLTHLKLEALNLEELSILLSANNESPCFMFPNLEELSVLSCSKLVFKPSLPKCAKYVIKESNMVLSCGQPLGPLSSPSIEKVEISGCTIPSGWLQWLRSMQTLEEVVIDGEALSSFELLKIHGTQGSSGSKISSETASSSRTNMSRELTTEVVDHLSSFLLLQHIYVFHNITDAVEEHLSPVKYRMVPLKILVSTAQQSNLFQGLAPLLNSQVSSTISYFLEINKIFQSWSLKHYFSIHSQHRRDGTRNISFN